jgi:hypothetical protein
MKKGCSAMGWPFSFSFEASNGNPIGLSAVYVLTKKTPIMRIASIILLLLIMCLPS